MKRLYFVFGMVMMGAAVAAAQSQVKKSKVEGITNFAQVETTVACAGAVTPESLAGIKKMGFASVINLRLASVCSIPHLFYSTKDLSVRARVIGQNLETSYESGGSSVGVLDAASDLVCASDAAGRRVLLWKVTAPAQPAFDLDMAAYSEKPILDLWMKKTRVKAG